MSRLFLGITLAAFVAASPIHAAPKPGDKSEGPAVIGQARSLNDLLDMVKATVKNLGGEKLYKEFEKEALRKLDPALVPGIDPKRPFGLYATVDADIEKSRLVVLIPVPGEKEFLEMLGGMEVKVTPGKEPGTFDVPLPPDTAPFPVALRIHKQYAYIALGGMDALDLKVLRDPKDVINEKEKAPLLLSLKPDRVPAEAKKFILSNLQEHVDHLKDGIPEPDLKEPFNLAQKLAFRWLKSLLDDGKEITLRLDGDTKTGDVFVEATVEGLPKSGLADAIARRPATKNAFASIATDDFAIRYFLTAPLFADEAKEAFVKLLDYGHKEVLKESVGAPVEAVALIEAGFKSLKATVESGEMDMALAMRGPNKEGFYTAVGAVHCKEAAQLEKAAKAAVTLIPDQVRGYFKLDAGKIGDINVHEIDLSSEAENQAKAIFGKCQKAYIAFGKNAIYATYGPDGMKLLKEAIEAKPGPAAVLDSTSDGKKTKDLIKKLMPEDNPNAGRRFVGIGAWESAITGMRVTVDSGDKLKIRVTYNFGLALMFFGSYAEATDGAAAAPPVKE